MSPICQTNLVSTARSRHPTTRTPTSTSRLGYGWSSTSKNANTTDYGDVLGSTAMSEDDMYTSDMTFQVNLPDGSYDVTPTLGDLGNYAHTAEVFLQGTLVDTVATVGGQVVGPTYLANVSDGVLSLSLEGVGSDGYAVIEGFSIAPTSQQEEMVKIGPTGPSGPIQRNPPILARSTPSGINVQPSTVGQASGGSIAPLALPDQGPTARRFHQSPRVGYRHRLLEPSVCAGKSPVLRPASPLPETAPEPSNEAIGLVRHTSVKHLRRGYGRGVVVRTGATSHVE
jgi:hypothetical protein